MILDFCLHYLSVFHLHLMQWSCADPLFSHIAQRYCKHVGAFLAVHIYFKRFSLGVAAHRLKNSFQLPRKTRLSGSSWLLFNLHCGHNCHHLLLGSGLHYSTGICHLMKLLLSSLPSPISKSSFLLLWHTEIDDFQTFITPTALVLLCRLDTAIGVESSGQCCVIITLFPISLLFLGLM